MKERIHEINTQSVLPVCSIVWMMRNTAPDGFFLCNGQVITINIENNLFIYLNENGIKHDCTEFVNSFVSASPIQLNATPIRVTLPDLRGKTCVGPKTYVSGTKKFSLEAGNSFSGMLPAGASQSESYQYLPDDYNGNSVRTKYKNVFSGAWGYNGDSFGTGAFKWVHDYGKSSGSSSHGGSGVAAIALDLKELFTISRNGTPVTDSASVNTDDLIPACVIVNPFIKVY